MPRMGWSSYFDALSGDSQLHAKQAADYVQSLAQHVKLRTSDCVLDFGCGFGHVAELLAPQVRQVCFWDASSPMRLNTTGRTARLPNVRLSDLSGMPERRPLAHERSAFDVILVNSVVQYITRDATSAWLVRWREMLAPGGTLVLSDLILPDQKGLSDLIDVARLGRRLGSPLAATWHAFGNPVRYWRTRRRAPLTCLDPEELDGMAAHAGLSMAVLPRNLTHFRTRWSAVLSQVHPRETSPPDGPLA